MIASVSMPWQDRPSLKMVNCLSSTVVTIFPTPDGSATASLASPGFRLITSQATAAR